MCAIGVDQLDTPKNGQQWLTNAVVYMYLASFPGVPIPAWRRDVEERLVCTVVRMHLVSEKSQKMGYSGNLSCNDDVQPQ